LVWVSKGFSNYKDATVVLKKHATSACHCEAVDVVITLPATTKDVGEQLSIAHQQEKQQNRDILLSCYAQSISWQDKV